MTLLSSMYLFILFDMARMARKKLGKATLERKQFPQAESFLTWFFTKLLQTNLKMAQLKEKLSALRQLPSNDIDTEHINFTFMYNRRDILNMIKYVSHLEHPMINVNKLLTSSYINLFRAWAKFFHIILKILLANCSWRIWNLPFINNNISQADEDKVKRMTSFGGGNVCHLKNKFWWKC